MAAADRPSAAARLTTLGRAGFFVFGVLPWALTLGRAYLPLGAVGEAMDRAFAPLCHRLPERTLVLAGVAMPLCSRCAGIFAGVAMGALVGRPRWPLLWWRRLIGATGALMVLDVVTQDLGIHPVWHVTRVVTGALFGLAIAGGCVSALRGEMG